jgi:septal ring factor EnvC (AmiA/AmiB activator)
VPKEERVASLLQKRLVRLERRLQALEARLDQTTTRLEAAVDVAVRVTRIVAVLNANMRTTHRRHRRRMDRLAETVVTGRTADAERLSELVRRLGELEPPHRSRQ